MGRRPMPRHTTPEAGGTGPSNIPPPDVVGYGVGRYFIGYEPRSIAVAYSLQNFSQKSCPSGCNVG